MQNTLIFAALSVKKIAIKKFSSKKYLTGSLNLSSCETTMLSILRNFEIAEKNLIVSKLDFHTKEWGNLFLFIDNFFVMWDIGGAKELVVLFVIKWQHLI